MYLSVSRFLLQTTVDGSCGLDVMCVVLGLKRERLVRKCFRLELVSFVLKHIGNRASATFMHALGEVSMNIGLFELAAAGAVLLADGGSLHDRGVVAVAMVIATRRCGRFLLRRTNQ